MFIKINNTDIYFEKHIVDNTSSSSTNDDVPTLIFLHGWGSSMRVFDTIISTLKSDYNIYAIDLCGFGNSTEPDTAWSVYEYADMVEEFILQENIKNPILLGHSFGGRLSIILASNLHPNLNLQKIVLINSAGFTSKRSIKYKYRVLKYKFAKVIKKSKIINFAFGDLLEAYISKAGSSDYQKASRRMKTVLTKAVNEDLSSLMKVINVPALLIWGENDNVTKLSEGKRMADLIPDSNLIVFKDAGHYSFLKKPKEFETALTQFLKEAK